MDTIKLLPPKEYISLILNYLKDESKIPKISDNDELKEYEIDVFSPNFFANLCHNCIYFYQINKKKYINSEERKYFFKEVVNMLDTIHGEFASDFLEEDFLKSILIYLVYSLKETRIENIEFVLKIFFNLGDFLPLENNKRINDEITKFENDIIQTIQELIKKFVVDFEVDSKISEVPNNYKDIMKYLKQLDRKIKKEKLPLYLIGFVKYYELHSLNQKKFVTIKMYNYFKKINPASDDIKNIDFYLYQGYSLYGILSDNKIQKIPKINFDEFSKIKQNRIKNIDAKRILEYAIQLLEKEFNFEFISELNKIDFEFESDNPKILDIFDNTERYYEEIFKQLRFYLSQYKKFNKNKLCKIRCSKTTRIFWLIFCKQLILNLSEDDIKKDYIKIIFYFITNLFNPEIPNDSLEFRQDAIPKLISESPNFSELLNNQEIYEIIDNYKYYSDFKKRNTFTETFFNALNTELFHDKNVKKLQNEQSIIKEILNIKKCNNNIPFPLLEDYLQSLNVINDTSYLKSGLYNFFKDCWPYLDDMVDTQKETFFSNLRENISSKSKNHADEIQEIINDLKFLNLIKEIMTSPVMQDAYKRINYWYSTNGEYDLDKEKIEDNTNEIKNFNKNSNLINNHPIIYYYQKLCESLNNLDINISNLFIVISLPKSIKGFTFRFLKIVINSQGIVFPDFQNQQIDKESKSILLQAYLIFVIIHEQNHFLKRIFNKNRENILCKTPDIKGCNEGGIQLIKLLFGDELIKQKLNIEQAKYIIKLDNWKKNSVYEFKRDFLAIKSGNGEDKCIVYLNSSEESICDHSKLFA